MTLEQVSLLAQIGGAVGILASLIFVGLQVRQNTQSQRIVAVESLAAAIAAINVPRRCNLPYLARLSPERSRTGERRVMTSVSLNITFSSASSNYTSRLGINTNGACSNPSNGRAGKT